MVDIAEHRVDHGQALEIVPDIELVRHAHATVQLYGLLPDEAAGLADLGPSRPRLLAGARSSGASSFSVTM
jgi:hypothetical protein